MLTATYALVALAVEQDGVRIGVRALQHYAHATLKAQQAISIGQLQYVGDTLERLLASAHWHKIDTWLIPQLRLATRRADLLLDELGLLNGSVLAGLAQLRERHQQASAPGAVLPGQAAEVCALIAEACLMLQARLDKEAHELFGVARDAICSDAWFAIARQFLQHDADLHESRRGRPPLPAPAGALLAVAPLGAAPALALRRESLRRATSIAASIASTLH